MTNTLPDGLPIPQRYWAVLVVSIGIGMSVLDGAIANIALPTIASDLRTTAATSIWVVNAYQLAVIASLLAFAVLGDMHGYKRVYQIGLVVFTLASAGCALSGTLPMLIAARIIQGLGAGAVMSVNTALARCIYPKRQLGRGIGLNALVVALSAAAGPTMASAILAVTTWQWLFAINLPFGLVAALLANRMLPTNPLNKEAVFDLPSTALNAAFFILLIISIDNLGHASASSMLVSFLLAALIGYVFVRRQLTLPLPLLPVDLLKIRLFSLSVGTSLCTFSAQMLAMVSLPFYLQQVLGRTEVMTGLLMTPWPIAIMIIAPWSGRLVDRHSPGKLCALGMLIFSAGLLSLALLSPQASNADIIWRMLLTGTGFGFFQAPNNFAIVASVPHQRSGGASGMQGMARLLGQTFGTTLVGLLFSWYGRLGTQHSLQLAALFALFAALVSAMRMKNTD